MKQRILDVAAQKINLYGLRKFTMGEIATELKISKKTIYKYFNSKDDIIREYFETTTLSDKNSVQKTLDGDGGFFEKIHKIIYSNHKYKLPVDLLNEVKLFYPEEWNKIEELKTFKLDAVRKLLEKASSNGTLKADINFSVLCKMLEKVSDTFTDYDFLLANKLKTSEAINEAVKIIFHGILKDDLDNH